MNKHLKPPKTDIVSLLNDALANSQNDSTDWSKIDTQIDHAGKKIVLPDDPGKMSIDTAIDTLERIREAIDQPRTGANVHAAPGLALERCARALHRAVDVVGSGIRNSRDHVAGGGIADVEHLAATSLDLAAVDEIAVDLDLGGG